MNQSKKNKFVIFVFRFKKIEDFEDKKGVAFTLGSGTRFLK